MRPATTLALLGTLSLGLFARAEEKSPAPSASASRSAAAPAVEMKLMDDSTVKAVLRDPQLELETKYGKLQIPVAEIRRIEFGLRLSDDVNKRVEAAVADLGHSEYRRRQAATTELLTLKDKAYKAVLQAAKSSDKEAARRAEQIAEKIRETVPAEHLDIRLHDVVYTEDSKIAGRITSPALLVSTLAFGEQQVKLTDVRGLRNLSGGGTEVAGEALPDPGTLVGYQNQVGKVLAFKVTAPAAVGAQSGVYGTDVYTLDSSLVLSAVHAGVLRPGQTGTVRVTILGQHPAFHGSTRNGIVSSPYGTWPGFRIEQPREVVRGN
jgi:hypothetical protein